MRLISSIAVILAAAGCAMRGSNIPNVYPEVQREYINSVEPTIKKISFLHSASSEGIPVIYVHGTPGSATGWANYVNDPIKGTYSIAIDRPGFGESQSDRPIIDLSLQAKAVVAILPEKTKQVILVGHSLGGAVIAKVAANYPEKIKALVFVASALDPDQEKTYFIQYAARFWPLNRLLPREIINANEELIEFKKQLQVLIPELKLIKGPVVIVHGNKDDLVPFENVNFIKNKLAGVTCLRIIELQGENHFLPWNSEENVRKAIDLAKEISC
jgi:pimeloyl-ACP methyl ester carboxylesterase